MLTAKAKAKLDMDINIVNKKNITLSKLFYMKQRYFKTIYYCKLYFATFNYYALI